MPLRSQQHFGCADRPLEENNVLDIISIVFNNPEAITEQEHLLADNFPDPYLYTVVDNSSKADCRKQIAAFCQRSGTGYIALPPNPFSGSDPSMSHGIALNWAYHHFVKPRAAKYFGFLDHDIFPLKPVKVIPKLQNQGFYGLRQDRGQRWYLWPGYCFYSREWTGSKALDFRPGKGLDTGGANTRFYDADPNDLAFASQVYPKKANLEFIDGWVHVMSSSGWKTGDSLNISEAIKYARQHIS